MKSVKQLLWVVFLTPLVSLNVMAAEAGVEIGVLTCPDV